MESNEDHQKSLNSRYIPTAEFYSQVIDSLQDYSIFTLDQNLKINSWSSGSARIFGYTSEEAIGESFDLIFTEEDLISGVSRKELELALKDGRATDSRWHIRKDKSLFYANGLVFPLIGMNAEMLGYVKILRDLTDRKQYEEAIKNYIKELEDLNKHKESVMEILSHDLRSPLTGIVGTAEYLKENFRKMNPDETQRVLDLIHSSSVNELNMLDYLVEWARIKYASDAFVPTKLKLPDYIDSVFHSLNEMASVNSIILLSKIKENDSVFADGKMLISIIQNIVSNAIKHSEKGGEVIVSAKQKEDKLIIQVKDTGVGMSQDIIDKIFTPQLDTLSEARKKNKGAGIGLILVKGFLEKSGGEIWVESTEGQGSSFYFTLPIDKPAYKIGSSDEIMFDESA